MNPDILSSETGTWSSNSSRSKTRLVRGQGACWSRGASLGRVYKPCYSVSQAVPITEMWIHWSKRVVKFVADKRKKGELGLEKG